MSQDIILSSQIDELDEAQGSDEAVEALFGRAAAAEMLGTDRVIQIAVTEGGFVALTAKGNLWNADFPGQGEIRWRGMDPPPGCEGEAQNAAEDAATDRQPRFGSDMPLEEVRSRLDKILAAARDPERAHNLEDTLHSDTLRAIAAGHSAPATLAAAALKSEDISFARNCA